MQPSATVAGNASPAAPAQRLPLYAMLAANAISGAGNVMTRLAIPWFVLETTGSAARTGIVGAVEAAPLLIAGVFGGALVDRVGFRRMSVLSDIASGATVAIIPALHFTVGLEFWQLLVLVFTGALLDNPGQTARRSFVPELAEAAAVPLTRANGYFGAINRSTALVGPLVAGVFIALFGAAPLLWMDSATFAVSAVLMLVAVPRALEPAPDPDTASGGYLADLKDGFRWIVGNRLIRTVLAMILITNLIESPFVIVLTVYAQEVFDSSIALGLLLGAFSVGAIVGSMLSDAVVARVSGRRIFPLAFSAICLLYVVLIVQASLPIILGLSVFVGLIAATMNPYIDTLFQTRVPRNLRGRVFGLRGAMAMAATPVGILLGGLLLEAAGLRVTISVQLVALLAVIVWMVVSPSLRALDD